MSPHDYTPEQALNTLMRKLRERDEGLSAVIQAAIDAGKDVYETEPSISGGKKHRKYRRTVPYTYQEALVIAIDALQAYFLEQPLFANSCAKDFSEADSAIPNALQPSLFEDHERTGDVAHHSQDQTRAIVIELQTETRISRGEQPWVELRTVSEKEIDSIRENLERLRRLTDFNGGHSGDTGRS